MSLFPDEDILTKEVESWIGFVEGLPEEDRKTFMKMLNDCYKYAKAINAKGRPFPTEALIMALIFSQHKLIKWLANRFRHHLKDVQLCLLCWSTNRSYQ
jgi:hypothetical protein